MSFGDIVVHLKSLVVPLVLFFSLLVFVMIQGRRALTSLVLGLYLALLLSLVFPYYDFLFLHLTGAVISETFIRVCLFALFTAAGAILFDRLLFYRIDESALQGLPKKAMLSLIGTILILAFSYHVLPFSAVVENSPVESFFAPDELFFWWLILPLLVLFLL